MKLTSIAEHSDYLQNNYQSFQKKWELLRNRINFGKQPLNLSMFIPCDEDGNVLTEPKLISELPYEIDIYQNKLIEYEKAKERVLFKYFKVIYNGYSVIRVDAETKDGFPEYSFLKSTLQCNQHNSIEDIVNKKIELTDSAIKQIGL